MFPAIQHCIKLKDEVVMAVQKKYTNKDRGIIRYVHAISLHLFK